MTHIVPLSDAALGILVGLPRWSGGDFVFSTVNGNAQRQNQRRDQVDDRVTTTDSRLPAISGSSCKGPAGVYYGAHLLARTYRAVDALMPTLALEGYGLVDNVQVPQRQRFNWKHGCRVVVRF